MTENKKRFLEKNWKKISIIFICLGILLIIIGSPIIVISVEVMKSNPTSSKFWEYILFGGFMIFGGVFCISICFPIYLNIYQRRMTRNAADKASDAY